MTQRIRSSQPPVAVCPFLCRFLIICLPLPSSHHSPSAPLPLIPPALPHPHTFLPHHSARPQHLAKPHSSVVHTSIHFWTLSRCLRVGARGLSSQNPLMASFTLQSLIPTKRSIISNKLEKYSKLMSMFDPHYLPAIPGPHYHSLKQGLRCTHVLLQAEAVPMRGHRKEWS